MSITNLIKKGIKCGDSEDIIHYIIHLYEFEKFRNILNLAFSLIKQNRLSFEVYKEGLIENNEGLCRITRSAGTNKYVIVLRRSNPYIIVHELSHMVEHELNLVLSQEFIHVVYRDIEQNLKQSNLLVKQLIDQVIFKEIKAYQSVKERASELFARYFELFSWSQEVYPKDRKYLVRIKDLDRVFFYTNDWKKNYLDLQLMNVIDKEFRSSFITKDINKSRTEWNNKFVFRGKRINSIFDDKSS
ncbi:MAG: hypothetical protein KTV77_00190 [Wolbachia endosymbiont of Fragariocoptes setiger]|nr:hypothetical protein [Wolbachia endosymbiont of Fragariocoptes setiger]